MKKTIITSIALAVASVVYAQPVTAPQDSVEIEIEGNRITLEADNLTDLSSLDLNKMIREVLEKTSKIERQQSEMIARIDKQLANGDITKEEAEEMYDAIYERTDESMEVISDFMENWGEAYGEKWEAWAENYEKRMEAWEADVEKRSKTDKENAALPLLPPLPPLPAPEMLIEERIIVADSGEKKTKQRIIISDKGIEILEGEGGEKPFALRFKDKNEIEIEEEVEEKKIKKTENYFDLNIGFNQLLNRGQYYEPVGDVAEQDFFGSRQFALGVGKKTRIGKESSKFYIKYGLEYSWHRFLLVGNNIIQKDPTVDLVLFTNDTTRNYTKSKYKQSYINVPIMFQLDFSKKGEMDEAITLGVGGYGGIKVTSKRVLKYNDFSGSETKDVVKGSFYGNPWRYGLMAQVGYKEFKITAQYDLNTMFNNSKDPNDYQMASITLGWSW